MSVKHVGVLTLRRMWNTDALKPYALFFDEVVKLQIKGDLTNPLPVILEKLSSKHFPDQARKAWSDIGFLHERGFLSEVDYDTLTVDEEALSDADREAYRRSRDELDRAFRALREAELRNDAADKELMKWGEKIRADSRYTDEEKAALALARSTDVAISDRWERYYACSDSMDLAQMRLAALKLRLSSRVDAVCIEHNWNKPLAGTNVGRSATGTDLYEIVVGGLPIVSDKVPWQDLFAFRSEDASRQQLRALRIWMAETVRSGITYAEAADRIEFLKEEYRAHMKGAGIKAKIGVVRALVVGAAGLIDNALALKLKDAAEIPFQLFDARVSYIEAQRSAVGRELAFIVRASDVLGSP